MIKKDLFIESGLFDTSIVAAEDREFFYRILVAYEGSQFYNLPAHLTRYRINPVSISHKKRFKQRLEALGITIQYAKKVHGVISMNVLKLLTKHTMMTLVGHPKIKPHAYKLYHTLKGITY